MKKFTKLIITSILLATTLCGCKKNASSLANPYKISNKDNSEIYDDTPLSYTNGFSKNIAVIGKDEPNSEGSDELFSESALLIDATTGEVLFQKNPHKREYPASTTKVLTALLALKYGDTSAVRKVGDEVIITESNVIMCNFRQGMDLVPFDVALHGALMKSGNDAAAVLALFASDSLSSFADLMNKEAVELGATESHFVNPHGLYDDNHYTTAYDLYLIFNEAIKYKQFVDTLSCKQYDSTLTRITAIAEYQIPCSWPNTNQYVNGILPTPDGVKVIGGKAGYTEKARRSYVMLAEADGHRYILVTMKSDSPEEMYSDLSKLLDKIPVNKKVYADNE